VHHTMIIENTSLMQQDKYIFHLYVFSICFGRESVVTLGRGADNPDVFRLKSA